MGKLIEINHVSLGGEVGTNEWAMPYLDAQHMQHANQTLNAAEALLLGRRTYEGLSAAYPKMTPSPFVNRMNALPKYVATGSHKKLRWNAEPIPGDVAEFVGELKCRITGNLVKYGNGSLDVPLMEKGLIDEFHVLLTPVATGTGQHLFEEISGAPPLHLLHLDRFDNGVVLLVYAPIPS